jgi:impB/mucB/samB family C-terminal domain
VRLYELARGIDENEVVPDRPTQSISVEDTLKRDLPLDELDPMIRRLAEKLWSASRKETRVARTVVLKLKTSEFKILTRSHTPSSPPASCEELTAIALRLPRTRRSRITTALSARRRGAKQLSGIGRDHSSVGALRMKAYQSAAAAPGGCCFMFSSIPFFISLAVGSALWVPAIQV